MIRHEFKPNEAHRILSIRFEREAEGRLRIQRAFDYGVRLDQNGTLLAFSFFEIENRPHMVGMEGTFFRSLGWSYPRFMGLQDGESAPQEMCAGMSEALELKNNGAPHRFGDKGLENGLQIHGTYLEGWELIDGFNQMNSGFTEDRAIFASQFEISHDL